MKNKVLDATYRFLERISGYRYFSRFKIVSKTRKRLLFLLPIVILFIYPAIYIDNTLIFALLITISVILLFASIIPLLVLNEKHELRNTLILMSVVIVGILFKILHLAGAGVIVTVGFATMGFGYLFLSIKLFFGITGNRYLKTTGSMGAFFISLFCLGALFKFQHWPGAGVVLYISLPLLLALTLVVLITLPGSNFIDWKKREKEVFLKKLVIPWLFFLVFTAFNFLVPEKSSNQTQVNSSERYYPFLMEPYSYKDSTIVLRED